MLNSSWWDSTRADVICYVNAEVETENPVQRDSGARIRLHNQAPRKVMMIHMTYKRRTANEATVTSFYPLHTFIISVVESWPLRMTRITLLVEFGRQMCADSVSYTSS